MTTTKAKRISPRLIQAARTGLSGRPVVLVGLMGAGKTTVGRRLAQRLQLPFVDADAEIELAAGKTIPEIFADHGEAYFRDGERKVITRLLDGRQKVVATGGGAYMNSETRHNINERACAVWLKADLPLLMKRVRRRSNRPLLQAPDPEAVMKSLIEERYPVYANARYVVESRDVPHSVMVFEVLEALAGPSGNE